LTVSVNDIDWAVGDKLTAVRFFELWPRTPWINQTTGETKKDNDITWVSDNHAQSPKANGGPPAVGTLSGGVCDLVFTDTGSFSPPTGGGVSSYLWTAHGGAPAVQAGALASSTVTLRYTTAGFYYVDLEVTDANAQTGKMQVPVIVDDGTLHLTRFAPADRYWDQYGWSLSRRLIGIDADETKLYDGALIIITADNTAVPSDAFIADRDNIRYVGWLIEDHVTRSYGAREGGYKAVSSAHIMSQLPAYPLGLRSDGSADEWYELTQLSIDSCVSQILRWQSTAFTVCDYHPVGDWTNRLRPGENLRADSLLSQIDGVLGACWANLRCSKQGGLYAMRHEWYLSAAEKAARATVMTLANQDFSDVRYGTRPHRARVREVRLLGVDGSSNPYMSGSPAEPLDGGKPAEKDKLAPKTQAELNQWAGQHLSNENWSIPLQVQMTGEYDVFDPALGEYVGGTLSSFDSKLQDGPYSVIGCRFEDDPVALTTIAQVELLPDPAAYGGYGSETRAIPVEPAPPGPPTDPPIFPDPLPDPVAPKSEVWCFTTTKGPYQSTDFTEPAGAMPTWTAFNTGLPDLLCYQAAYDRANPADDRFFAIMTTAMDLYRSEGGGNWSKVLDVADGETICSVTTASGTPYLGWVTVDEVTGRVWVVYYPNNTGGGATRLFLLYSDLNGDSGAGNWNFYEPATSAAYFYSDYQCVRAYNGNILLFAHKSAGGNGLPAGAGHNMYYSSNNGAAWAATQIASGVTTYPLCGGDHAVDVPLTGYGRVFDSGTAYDLHKTTGSTATIDDANDLGPWPDAFWFARLSTGVIMAVKKGDITTTTSPILYLTEDAFATTPNKYLLPYYNIKMMARYTHDQSDDYLLFGAEDCDDGSAGVTQHHVLISDRAIDPLDLTGKAGANVGTGPGYVDSIPEDSGGPCYDGVIVV
jgi:hypothetical protein